MTGGHIAEFKKYFRLYLVFGFLMQGSLILAVGYFLAYKTSLEMEAVIGIVGALVILSSVLVSYLISVKLTKPTEMLAQAIFHVSPNEHLVAAPNVDELSFGKDLIANLTRQIYDYAATHQTVAAQTTQQSAIETEFLDSLPVPVIGLDEAGNIALCNATASTVFSLNNAVGNQLQSALQFKFNNQTIFDWISESRNKAINTSSHWYKVEIASVNGNTRNYYDIAATIRQKHPSGVETLMVCFNYNELFDSEQDAISIISLAVHEIRTPLTILRGYVEALKEEMAGKVDPNGQQYIDRLSAASENLASFMANILSVARADQNQLTLHLSESSWDTQLRTILTELEPRAAVRGKAIQLTIAQNLPNIAIDTVSISEVLTNLIDNAIKYSPETAKNIWIDARLDTDGSVLTTIKDEGVGIPDHVVQNLFTRFYRNHQNRAQIMGTGLGLYISREIIRAHHGNIWIKSKEGEGTTVGFTLVPYTKLADMQKTEDNGFRKVQHGWIKNHSMQRR